MVWIFNRQTNEVKKNWMLSLNVKMKQKEGSSELLITVDVMSGLHFQWLITWDAYLTHLCNFFHIWRRREFNLAISYFVHIVPAYTFMSQFWPAIWLTRTMLCKTRQFLVQLLNHKQKWRQRRYDLNTPSSEQTFHKRDTPSNLTWKAH